MAVHLRIVGTNPPGRTFDRWTDVQVGVQRGKEEVLGWTPGDQPATFAFDLDVRDGRFAGPYAQGRPGERFVYLVWTGEADGGRERFRRAKLRLDHLDAEALDGRTIEAHLSLTDGKGGPVCASVQPPAVDWRT